MPEFGTPHPARDYPPAPSVDLKHDRGNCAARDVRDRWKESESGRGHYLSGGGALTIQTLLKSGHGPAKRSKKVSPFMQILIVYLLFLSVDLNEMFARNRPAFYSGWSMSFSKSGQVLNLTFFILTVRT